jgi:protocatechuate 3,4-dioxygenase beta subunit
MSLRYRRNQAGLHPPLAYPDYASTLKRAPMLAPVRIEHTLSEITGPRPIEIAERANADLSRVGGRRAIGERIVVTGRVVDEDGHPLPATLIEIWQANAAGRYAHQADAHDAPLDPNFEGVGRVLTDDRGWYKFQTIKPGAYPWRNHPNAWRPNHIHFSLFGPAFATRLITQMYFPGDPLLELDPIFKSVPDAAARARLVARFEIAETIAEVALGYRFDIVLRGNFETPLQPE